MKKIAYIVLCVWLASNCSAALFRAADRSTRGAAHTAAGVATFGASNRGRSARNRLYAADTNGYNLEDRSTTYDDTSARPWPIVTAF
jgi:hypothetical protein